MTMTTTPEATNEVESVTIRFDVPVETMTNEDGSHPVITVTMEATTAAKAVQAMEALHYEYNEGLMTAMAELLVRGTMIELEGLDSGILDDYFSQTYSPFRIFVLPLTLWDDFDKAEMEVVLSITAPSADAALEAFDKASSHETLHPFQDLGFRLR